MKQTKKTMLSDMYSLQDFINSLMLCKQTAATKALLKKAENKIRRLKQKFDKIEVIK